MRPEEEEVRRTLEQQRAHRAFLIAHAMFGPEFYRNNEVLAALRWTLGEEEDL